MKAGGNSQKDLKRDLKNPRFAKLFEKEKKKLEEIHDYDYSETTDFLNMKGPLTLKDLGFKTPSWKTKPKTDEFLAHEFMDRVFCASQFYELMVRDHNFLQKNKNVVIKKLTNKIGNELAVLYQTVAKDRFKNDN